jgi:hypothetical protein
VQNGKYVWYRRTMAGKCIEIIIAAVFLALFVFPVSAETFAAEENETAYRVKPLQEKLAALEDDDIDKALSLYGDMDSHWSRREVGMLSYIDIISGYGGNFHPNDPVQVDQYIKMVVRSMGYAPGEDTKYWAQNYINIASEQKLIATNEFQDYKRPITREEAARIIVKAALLKEEFPYSDPYNTPDNLVRSKIKDYVKINDMNKQYVLKSYEIGLIHGSDGYFRPAGTLTRAEAATIMIRYLNDDSRVPFTPAADEVFTCVNEDGTVDTIWPPMKKEVIDAANAFTTAWPKSKGYVSTGYSDSHLVFYVFYENEEMYKQNSILNMQMVVDVSTMNDIDILRNPYHITLYDADAVKRLHRDAIYEMFKFWFEQDADKAMKEFDRYLGYATSNDQEHRIDEITYNGRLMFFNKIGGDNGFTLLIHCLE